MALIFAEQNRLARCDRYIRLALELAELIGSKEHLFHSRYTYFAQLAERGLWADAEAIWQDLDPMGRDWQRSLYRPGMAEEAYARFQFLRGRLTDGHLTRAEQLARSGRNRRSVRSLHELRAEWLLQRHEWALATGSLHEAVRMTREAGLSDTKLETQLALARFHLGQLPDAREVAIRLSGRSDPVHLALAELWEAIGDSERATEHALAAYRWSWADGEPYVHAYELARAKALLERLGAEVPVLPAYDPAREQPLDIEIQVRAAIRDLRAKKQEEQRGDD